MKYFTKEHEWIEEVSENVYAVGITQYATEELGEIVYLDPKPIGETVNTGESIASVESVKTISDVYTPFNGEIIAFNDEVVAKPELINEAAEESAWIVKMKINNSIDLSVMMTKSSYDQYLQQLSQ